MNINQHPEQIVRDEIDKMLHASGWLVQSKKQITPRGSIGVNFRNYRAVNSRATEIVSVHTGAELAIHLNTLTALQVSASTTISYTIPGK